MFKTKKQLKEEIKRLQWDVEEEKIHKEIAENQLKIAEGEMRKAKCEVKLWKNQFQNKIKNLENANDYLLKRYSEQAYENIKLKEEIKNLQKKSDFWQQHYNSEYTAREEIENRYEKLLSETKNEKIDIIFEIK